MNNRNFSKAVEAVSPVVATLLLVLVAAGAAIGFGVFLNGFQKDTQENVASNAPEQTLRIGGSSTVFDFSNVAKGPFENANPQIVVDLQKGGSGGGLAAICLGNLDIGSSSDDPTTLAAWAKCPDLDGDGVKDSGRSIKLTKVAYDAINIVTSSAAWSTYTGCSFTVEQVIEIFKVNGDGAARTAAASADLGRITATAGAGPYTFGDLDEADAPCAGSTAATPADVVVLVERSDNGGTEADFCTFLLKLTASLCNSSDKQLALTTSVAKSGNDGVQTEVGARDDALAFADVGGALNPSKSYNGASPKIKIAGVGTTVATMVPPPTYSATATSVPSAYKASVQNCVAKLAPSTTVHPACRSMFYMTIGEPQGNARAYLDFVTQTDNNIAFSNAGFFVPLY